MEIPEGLFFLKTKYDNAGEVWESKDLDHSKSDYLDINIIADRFARMGHTVRILSPIHFKSPLYSQIYGGLIGTRYERKCPDLLIDDKYYEYESYQRPWNKRKLANMLTDGLRQSDNVILDNRDGVSIRQAIRAVRARLNVNAQISEVWLFDGDTVIDIYP